jgi:two-component system, chemotaxis family, CheB/CheR fusion protein
VTTTAAEEQEGLPELLGFLKSSRGFDFGGYKPASLGRRIHRRMSAVGVSGYSAYQEYLELNPDEYAALFDTVLINVTSFFRDGQVWDHLENVVLPELLSRKPAESPIRVWSAGCASGEEACTAAMVLARLLGLEEFRRRVKVYATDVDEHALAAGRAATYTDAAVRSVPEEHRQWLERAGDAWTVHKDIRRVLIYGRHDLFQDAPISRIDLLLCRNALIYFNAETQAQILNRFAFALNDDGVLVLGKAEMLLTHGRLFTPIDLRRRVFRKADGTRGRANVLGLTGPAEPERVTDLARLLVETSPLAQFVIDADGRLGLLNERAAALFDLTPADVGSPFQDLDLSFRPVDLRTALRQAQQDRAPVRLRDVEWQRSAGERVYLEVQVTPLLDRDGELAGIAVTFADVSRHHQLQTELEHANAELETAYEELQSTNEELETTNEELQSTVEELETTNEELQSTNEELETMNEELHSTNDELSSINDMLRERTRQLDAANAHLEAILASLDSAVAVLDEELAVRLWNGRAVELWGLRPDEVAGQDFLSLDIGLPVADLRPTLRDVLTGGTGGNRTVDAVNRRGRPVRVDIQVGPLHLGSEPIGAVVFMRDAPA